MPVLLAQCTLPPVLLVLVSLLQRRRGPASGGLLAGLPLTSGPVVLFTALHGGATLAGRTAAATLDGVIPACLLCWTYAAAARRHGPRGALARACGVFAASAAAVEAVRPGPAAALAAACVALAAAARWWPAAPADADRAGAAVAAAPAGESPLAVRMALVTGYVATACVLTWRLGPQATGPFAPFPVLVTVQAAHTHRARGALATAAFLRAVVRSGWSFLAFFTLLAVLLPGRGTAVAFAGALCGCAAAQWAAGVSARSRRPR
jgi:hypothetical protein